MSSDIQEFYRNQTVFIAGGTGFLGKVFIEKLLRTCPDLHKLCLLIRPKRGKTEEQRFDDIFNYACFDELKRQFPDFKSKVQLVQGDCEKPMLGLLAQDLEYLREEATILVHAAADVRFNQPLRLAANSNVRSVQTFIDLVRQIRNLKVFVYVSTAYSHCTRKDIKEEFYEPPMTAEQLNSLIDCQDDATLEAIAPHLLKRWPNTYTWTKAVAEDLLLREGAQLPLVIIRPSIIFGSAKEPMPGWIDNFYGVIGIISGAFVGVIKVMHGNKKARLAAIPCDYVANGMLASIWEVGAGQAPSPRIYNYTGGYDDTFQLDRMVKISFHDWKWKIASSNLVSFPYFFIVENLVLFKILAFLLHTVPAYFADFVLLCLGKKTMAVSKMELINSQLLLTSHFSNNTWNFDRENVTGLWKRMSSMDQKLFHFDMKQLDLKQFCQDNVWGGRRYLFNDDDSTVPAAMRRLYMHTAFHFGVLIPLFIYLLYRLFAAVFSFII